jgi:hypothetical protein
MVAATMLAVSPWGFVALMIWRQRRFFVRTRAQIRALPEIMDSERTWPA